MGPKPHHAVRVTALCAALVGSAGCADGSRSGSAESGAVQGRGCDAGVVTSVADVPQADWPPQLSSAMTTMGALWASPFTATAILPGATDQTVSIAIPPPAAADMSVFAPPTAPLPGGALYMCSHLSEGTTTLTITGFTARETGFTPDAQPIAIDHIPLHIDVLDPADGGIMVDCRAKQDLPSGEYWQTLTVNVGIDAKQQLYGSIYVDHQTASGKYVSGQTVQFRLTNFQLPVNDGG